MGRQSSTQVHTSGERAERIGQEMPDTAQTTERIVHLYVEEQYGREKSGKAQANLQAETAWRRARRTFVKSIMIRQLRRLIPFLRGESRSQSGDHEGGNGPYYP